MKGEGYQNDRESSCYVWEEVNISLTYGTFFRYGTMKYKTTKTIKLLKNERSLVNFHCFVVDKNRLFSLLDIMYYILIM